MPALAASPPSPSRKAAEAKAPPPPLTAAAAPTLATDAASLSAFGGLLPRELIVFSPGSLSRVAGVDGEGTLWVELVLDENEIDDDDGGGGSGSGEGEGLSLRSALSPTALRPGDAVMRAPEHVRIDFEARTARRDQKSQQRRAEAAAAAAAAAAALKAEQAKKQKGRVRR